MSKWKRTSIVRQTEFRTREDDGRRYIEGYFAVFNSEYWLWNDAFETIDPGAFNLEADKDVRALTNHDTTLVLGRTTAGTLTLRTDERGLFGSVLINERDQDAVNAYERVRRGDVSQCSFGFNVLDQAIERRDDGMTVWHLKQVRLFEVSICTFPAYEDTEVEARKAELEDIRRREAELEEIRQREQEEARKRELGNWRAQALARIRGEKPESKEE